MPNELFSTEIIARDGVLQGPFRRPRQMLADQLYDGHTSIHDDAQELGFSGTPIEGPTHFSQFEPLLVRLWGQRWLESGCISSPFKTVVVEEEEVQAFVEVPAGSATITRVWATKKTGEPVLEGTTSLGPEHPETMSWSPPARSTAPISLTPTLTMQKRQHAWGWSRDATQDSLFRRPAQFDTDHALQKGGDYAQ